ncbi:MAG TPA: DUF4328 domain-containing protein [Pseudonocardiaceae bacterium]
MNTSDDHVVPPPPTVTPAGSPPSGPPPVPPVPPLPGPGWPRPIGFAPIVRPPAVLRPVAALGQGAGLLICLVSAVLLAGDLAAWNTYVVVRDYLAGDPSATESDVLQADRFTATTSVAALVMLLVAGIVFILWLRRARANCDALYPMHHRHAPGWVIGSWICPIVNLWYPKQIVDDVWHASDPATVANPAPSDRRGSGLVLLWWSAWIVAFVVPILLTPLGSDPENPTVDGLRADAFIGLSASLPLVVAAVAAVLLIRRINAWQDPTRRPVVVVAGRPTLPTTYVRPASPPLRPGPAPVPPSATPATPEPVAAGPESGAALPDPVAAGPESGAVLPEPGAATPRSATPAPPLGEPEPHRTTESTSPPPSQA